MYIVSHHSSKHPPHTGGWMSRDLGAPPTRDRDARDRERPLEVVSRARWDFCKIHVAVWAPNVKLTDLGIAAIEFGGSIRPPEVPSKVQTTIVDFYMTRVKIYVAV